MASGFDPSVAGAEFEMASNQGVGQPPRKTSLTCGNVSAPGRIRTCDTGFRRAVLYPLSYEGGDLSE